MLPANWKCASCVQDNCESIAGAEMLAACKSVADCCPYKLGAPLVRMPQERTLGSN